VAQTLRPALERGTNQGPVCTRMLEMIDRHRLFNDVSIQVRYSMPPMALADRLSRHDET
jgi:hypothetical protein